MGTFVAMYLCAFGPESGSFFSGDTQHRETELREVLSNPQLRDLGVRFFPSPSAPSVGLQPDDHHPLAMDRFIDARFDRVEKALVTLIDSVAKYNPSPALADDLLAADRELNRGLETCMYWECEHAGMNSGPLTPQCKRTRTTTCASSPSARRLPLSMRRSSPRWWRWPPAGAT